VTSARTTVQPCYVPKTSNGTLQEPRLLTSGTRSPSTRRCRVLPTNRQELAAASAPYFGFAPADDPEAPLTANALYFRIQVHSGFCCAHVL